MADDWQDAAFSSRHMHNNRGNRSKRNTFDVRKAFGSYSIKCAAWQKLDGVSPEHTASLELYRLTENGEGVVGEIALPGALNAATVFAASRKSLGRIIEGLEEEEDQDDEAEDEIEDDNEDSDAAEQDRFQTFEKNSFRSPKFWFRWSGVPIVMAQSGSKEGEKSNTAIENTETGLGYVVFAGNDCRKFKGTINCAQFGWKDVALTGHKIAARSESDVPVAWGTGGVAL
jgi:hypothetical protein